MALRNSLSNLASVFLNEMENYRKLLVILHKEQKILIERKISKLSNFVAQEREIIYQIGECEEQRNELIERISEMTGIPAQELLLNRLIELAGEELAERFSEITSEIRKIAREFRTVNQCNRELIDKHREYIKFIIELVSKYDTPGQTYRQDGTIKERKSMSLLNKQV